MAGFGLGDMRAEDWGRLVRVPLLLMVTASTLVGALFAGASFVDFAVWQAAFGTSSLTVCATILNQIQERKRDALMLRTKRRPLVTGRLKVCTALALSVVFAGLGLGLMAAADYRAAATGLLALFWYNLLYTPLKVHTPFAVFPGAVSGALPPLIGWLAAGGPLVHPHILLLVGLLGLWQIPHFLLLAHRYQEDYRRAGLPSLADQLGSQGLFRVIFIWVLATVLFALSLTLLGPLHGVLPNLLLPVAGSWLVFGLTRPGNGNLPQAAFLRVNLFLMMVFVCIALEGLVPF